MSKGKKLLSGLLHASTWVFLAAGVLFFFAVPGIAFDNLQPGPIVRRIMISLTLALGSKILALKLDGNVNPPRPIRSQIIRPILLTAAVLIALILIPFLIFLVQKN